MEKCSGVLATVIAVIAVAGLCEAQDLSTAENAYVDSLMSSRYKASEPGAAILIARDGQVVFRKAYGMANLELQIPNRPEYVFRIGSISKQFMAVCILRLAQEGKLSLDDDIRKYLPDYDTHDREITIEHLLTHTNGIPSYTEKSDFLPKSIVDHSKEEMVDYFAQDALLFEPGTGWIYSNSGYMLIGLIVEAITGISLEDYMQQHIFEPLEMSHTYTFAHKGVMPGAVSGYEAVTDSTVGPASYLSKTWPYGGGLVLSSVDDLHKWINAIDTDEIVSRTWLQRAWTPFELSDGRSSNYGYGWGIIEYRGLQIIKHDGGIHGFLSDGVQIPSRNLYVVLLSNTTANPPGAIAALIALRLARIGAVPAPIDSEALAEYSGVYELHRVDGAATTNVSDETKYSYVSVNEGTMFLRRAGGAGQRLIHTGEDWFLLESGTIAQFRRSADGRIVSVEVYGEFMLGPSDLCLRTELPLPAEKTPTASEKKDVGGH